MKKHAWALCLLLIPLWWPSLALAQPTILPNFSPPLPGLAGATLAWGDLDSDGDPDLFVSGATASGQTFTHLLENTGSAFVVDANQVFPALLGCSADWADFDGDGDLDLALSGSEGKMNPKTLIYRNDAGQLNLLPSAAPQLMNGAVHWADFDGDGDPDLFLSGYHTRKGNTYAILENLGNGQMAGFYHECPFGLRHEGAAVGDIDGDGLPDLVIGGFDYPQDGALQVYRNAGQFQFAPVHHFAKTKYHTAMDLGDFNGDQTAELLVCGDASVPMTEVVDFNGGQMFALPLGLNGITFGAARWVDFDQDQDLDLVVTGRQASGLATLIYRNQGGQFTLLQSSATLPQLEHTALEVADWNGDGYPDLVVAGHDEALQPYTFLLTYDPLTQTYQP